MRNVPGYQVNRFALRSLLSCCQNRNVFSAVKRNIKNLLLNLKWQMFKVNDARTGKTSTGNVYVSYCLIDLVLVPFEKKSLTVFTESSFLEFWLGSENASAEDRYMHVRIYKIIRLTNWTCSELNISFLFSFRFLVRSIVYCLQIQVSQTFGTKTMWKTPVIYWVFFLVRL